MTLRAKVLTIPDGDAGTIATLEQMKRLVLSEYATDKVRTLAANIVAESRAITPRRQLLTVREFMRSAVVFTEDPRNVETLHTPERMIEMFERSGVITVDCDDAAILGAALVGSLGFPARFVAVALDPDPAFCHVWAEADVTRGNWLDAIELDVTRPFQRVPVDQFRRVIFFPVLE